jgi:hypothetical protein
MGELRNRVLGPDGDAAAWIDSFLKLEASGWKGREGSAFASSDSTRRFFQEVAAEAFRRQRLMMLALEIDGKPIAQKFNLLAGRGSFAFKIAYDEAYAPYSPGLQLEIENIRRLHEMTETDWMDSCAIADHPVLSNLWLDGATVQTVVISTGRFGGDLLVSLFPLIRWINRKRLALKNPRRKPAVVEPADE